MMQTPVRVALGAALTSVLALATATDLAAQASKGVHVCLGTDNVLRFTSADRCPQGQRMFRLAEVEDEVGVTKDRDDPPNAVVADLKSKVDFLTRRVSALESESRKSDNDPKPLTQVKAPFEVVDKQGNPIFVVADVAHASVARRGRFQIAQSVGGMSMVVRSASGTPVLGLGDATEGGAMYVSDPAGGVRMFLSGESGLKLHNKSSSPVVHLTAGSGGAGQFWLYDATGTPMVMAGTLTGGVGTVEVGPGRKCVPTGNLRVPDCIRGRTQ